MLFHSDALDKICYAPQKKYIIEQHDSEYNMIFLLLQYHLMNEMNLRRSVTLEGHVIGWRRGSEKLTCAGVALSWRSAEETRPHQTAPA